MKIDNRKVLVLNKGWSPISIISLPKAITILFGIVRSGMYQGEPKARIIDPYNGFQVYSWSEWEKLHPEDDEDCILGCKTKYRVPEIILLTKYEKPTIKKLGFNKKSLFLRDDYTCQYCGTKFETNELTIDHIMPKSYGGNTSWENCVTSCRECNGQKADRIPEKATKQKINKKWIGPSPMKLLSEPKRPNLNKINEFIHAHYKTEINNVYIPHSWDHFLK